MAFFDSAGSHFFLANSTAASQDISSYITSIDGLPGKRDYSDVAVLGSVGHQWFPSLENAEFTIDVLYSEDATNGSDTVLGPMRTASTTRAFVFWPSTTTGKNYAGNCWLDDYSITSRVGSIVSARVHCKVDNGVTRT